MFLHFFSMNFLRILVASWTIFIRVQETVSLQKVLLLKAANHTPLAVIKNRDSSLQLAIPHYKKYGDDPYAAYKYDDVRGDKLMMACPASGDKQLDLEKNGLLFLSEYTELDAQCSTDVAPTVKKVAEGNTEDHVEHCSQLQAEMYEVGYPVSKDDEGKDVQFLSIYKICYSQADGKGGTLYSIHRIKSPSLLFMNSVWELPPDDIPLVSKDLHKSVLDISLSPKESSEGVVYYNHQFVGVDDMSSIRRWEETTFFLFNYTPITINEDLYKGLIRAEWFIRLFSKKKNKPLTLYSGTHQRIEESGKLYWIMQNIGLADAEPTDSFWRIIMDDEGYAIILVIQHNLKNCGSESLCKTILGMKTYKKGGCIYTCSMKENDDLFELLSLPPLKIIGELDFTIQASMGLGGGKYYDIIKFLSKDSFLDTLMKIDSNILPRERFIMA